MVLQYNIDTKKVIAWAVGILIIFLAGVYVGHHEFPRVDKVTTQTKIVEKPVINTITAEGTHTSTYEIVQKPTVVDPVTGATITDPKAADIAITTQPLTLAMTVNGTPYPLQFKTDTTSKFQNDQLKVTEQFNATMALTAPVPSKIEGIVAKGVLKADGWLVGGIYRPNPKNGFGITVIDADGKAFVGATFPIGNLQTVK